MNASFKMSLTALQEVPAKSGALPMFKLTGIVDNTLQVFTVPFGSGSDLREKLREIYGFQQMFAPPAALELQGHWRGDAKAIFDATSIKASLGAACELQTAPKAKQPEPAL